MGKEEYGLVKGQDEDERETSGRSSATFIDEEEAFLSLEYEDGSQKKRHALDALKDNVRNPGLKTYVSICLVVAFLLISVYTAFTKLPRSFLLKPSPDVDESSRGEYVLDPNWKLNAAPVRRDYHWTIQDEEFNPDGVYRPGMLINGQFPGPLIELNEGDTLVVHVQNAAKNATSIHWHGIYQNGTNWMDGTVGITQCPIAPGANFTYEFKIQDQAGTFWYHGHYGVQAADGLYGPLIVHSKSEREQLPMKYATDRILMFSDHYYTPSPELLMHYLKPDMENAEPVPDIALINGKNIRNCDDITDRKCDNSTSELETLYLDPAQNHRLRILNVGAFAEFQIQIDEHEFAVIEVDQTLVEPKHYHRLNILPAQRYSIVIGAAEEHAPSYWLRARMVTHCFAEENPILIEEVRAIIHYTDPSSPSEPKPTPESRDWPEVIELECRDLNTTELHPLMPIQAPATAHATLYLRASFRIGNWRLSRGFFNGTSWRTPYSNPSLHRFVDGMKMDNASFTASTSPARVNGKAFDASRELVYETTGIQTIDILISNFDDGAHPIHLHGYTFFVIAQGHGYPPDDLPGWLSNHTDLLWNPLRRDTATVEAFGWQLIRVVADNPGMWALHCHIAWHAEAGMMMQLAVRKEVMGTWELPGKNLELCALPGIEKGMGPDDSIWFGDMGGND